LTDLSATPLKENKANPKGGCMNEVCILAPRRTPNQIKSIPSFSATGASSGMMMNAIAK